MATQNAINNYGIPAGMRIIQDTGPIEYNPSAAQVLTTSYADVAGSDYSFTPASASSTILYHYVFHRAGGDAVGVIHMKLLNNGTLVPESENTSVIGESATLGGQDHLEIYEMPVASWGTSAQILKMQARGYSASFEAKLHETLLWDGATSSKLRRGVLQITEYL